MLLKLLAMVPTIEKRDAYSIANNNQKGAITMKRLAVLLALLALVLLPINVLFGHCDTMNGPVVTAAKKALETGNVNLVLIWVQKKDESLIKEAFQKTLAVRKLNPDAQKLADMYFFETLVRTHRAGEGEAYTGIEPAETEVDPGIAAADQALEDGSNKELIRHLTDAVAHAVDEQLKQVLARKNYKKDDIVAGREYVEAYVRYIHYVERLYLAVESPAEGHYHETNAGESQHRSIESSRKCGFWLSPESPKSGGGRETLFSPSEGESQLDNVLDPFNSIERNVPWLTEDGLVRRSERLMQRSSPLQSTRK